MRPAVLFFCGLLASAVSFAQSLSCVATAENVIVRSEGHAERVGDIDLRCSGGTPNQPVTGNLNLFTSVNLTNRLVNGINYQNLLLLVDNGSGLQQVSVLPRQQGVNSAVWDNVQFTLSSQGTVVLKIQNIRLAASQTPGQPLIANLAFNAGSLVAFFSPTFQVGRSLDALLGNATNRLICAPNGSPLPSEINFTNLLATSAYASVRVTEGFADAFAQKSAAHSFLADTGTRIRVRYSGFPNGARIFVPDVIAGADAVQPTSAGEFGNPPSGGQYQGGQRSLLLARVAGADATGAGGSPIIQAPPASAGVVSFNTVSEVNLVAGEGYAVYEVIDADPNERQNAQIPTFLGLAPGLVPEATEPNVDVSLAPVSNVVTASPTAPIPRFNAVAPKNDCTVLGDCNANYLPRFAVSSDAVEFSATVGQSWQSFYLPVRNGGGGTLRWSATVAYQDGANWLRLDSPTGINNGTLRIDANAAGLAPGTYRATINLVGGTFVSPRTIPVTLTVTDRPVIRSISNGASANARAEVVPGSMAFLRGLGFAGSNVAVTIDGTAAKVVNNVGSDLMVLVPDTLTAKDSAPIVVTVDGKASASSNVRVSANAPAIFSGAVYNQNFTANGMNAPAQAGSAVVVYATGLPVGGTLTGRVHDQEVTPLYAGPAPGMPGIYQFNLRVDPLFPAMETYVYVCGTEKGSDRKVCSAAAPLSIGR
jgi:uncharacterized protein (TIGR03437 family)